MSLIKKILLFSTIFLIISLSKTFASDLKKVGKFKDWEVMVVSETSGKVCFAQSIPVLQAPKKNKREKGELGNQFRKKRTSGEE